MEEIVSGCLLVWFFFFLMLFVSQEVAMVIFGSIPSAPVVLSRWGALEGVFFPPYQT